MTDNVITVIDAVIDEWLGAFQGSPEEQIEAFEYVADARDALVNSGSFECGQAVAAIHSQPRDLWSEKLKELWDDIKNNACHCQEHGA